MVTNVAARVRKLKDDGKVPERAAYRIFVSGLNCDEANSEEIRHREASGSLC